MKRLVKTPATSLDEMQTRKLMTYVKRAFEQSKSFFDKIEKEKRRIYRQDIGSDDPNDPLVDINMSWAYLRTMAPNLFFQDPHFTCRPNKPGRETSADTWASLMNAVISRTGYRDYTSQCIYDALERREAWKKWIYTDAVEDTEYTGEGALDAEPYTETEMGEAGPTSWDTIEAPVGVRLNPTNIATDSKTRNLEDSRFIVVRYHKRLEEVIADPLYPKVDKDFRSTMKTGYPTQTNVAMQPSNEPGRDSIVPDDDEIVTIYEVWVAQLVDLNLYRQLVVLMEGHDEKPIAPIKPWSSLYGNHMRTYPFTKVVLAPVNDAEPFSLLVPAESLQRVLNVATSRMVAIMRSLKSILAIDPTKVLQPDVAKKQLESARTIEVIETQGEDARNAIHFVDQPQIPSDLYSMSQMLMSFLTQILGFSQNQRGGAGVRTATEANVIDKLTTLRTNDLVARVSDFIKRDGEMLVALLRNVVTPGFVFQRIGDVGGVAWQNFTQDDADWSPDVEVQPHSFRQAAFDEEAQKYLQAISVGSQIALRYPVRLDVLYNKFLKRLEIPEADRVLADPVSDVTKQLEEILMAVAGTYIDPQPYENHQIELGKLEEVINSQQFREGAFGPQVSQWMLVHRAKHQEFQQQAQQSAPQIDISGDQATFGNADAMAGVASGVDAQVPSDQSPVGSTQLG